MLPATEAILRKVGIGGITGMGETSANNTESAISPATNIPVVWL
jgi:biotin synthase-like enzyme